jgi:hypothetical protein
MAKNKGTTKGDKLRAERALAEEGRRARAGAADPEVDVSPDKRQKEDDDGVQPKKKQKQKADKARAGYRV